MTKYYLFEADWSNFSLKQKEITVEEFKELIQEHNPEHADRIIEQSKITNGQCFLSQSKSQVDKRIFYQQIKNEI